VPDRRVRLFLFGVQVMVGDATASVGIVLMRHGIASESRADIAVHPEG
jgi:hypothetical protein